MGNPKTTHKHGHAQKDKDAHKTHMGVKRTLRRSDVDDQVETLHRLLNHHLPADNPLPVGRAPGARDFGPLTEDRVKKFQRDRKINFGTDRYMSGVVDDTTWSALTEKTAVVLTVKPVPNSIEPSAWLDRKRLSLGLPPLNPPSPLLNPGPYLTPPWSKPSSSGSEVVVLDGVQTQIGGPMQYGSLITIPFSPGGPHLEFNTAGMHSAQLQVVMVLLRKGNKDLSHIEGQGGFLYQKNRGPGADSRKDFGFLFVLNEANIKQGTLHLPWGLNRRLHLDGGWNFGVQEQVAVMTSLSNGLGSIQGAVLPTVNLNLYQSDDGKNLLQLTGQAGLMLELDPPRGPGGYWVLKAGPGGFVGMTYTYTFGKAR